MDKTEALTFSRFSPFTFTAIFRKIRTDRDVMKFRHHFPREDPAKIQIRVSKGCDILAPLFETSIQLAGLKVRGKKYLGIKNENLQTRGNQNYVVKIIKSRNME